MEALDINWCTGQLLWSAWHTHSLACSSWHVPIHSVGLFISKWIAHNTDIVLRSCLMCPLSGRPDPSQALGPEAGLHTAPPRAHAHAHCTSNTWHAATGKDRHITSAWFKMTWISTTCLSLVPRPFKRAWVRGYTCLCEFHVTCTQHNTVHALLEGQQ